MDLRGYIAALRKGWLVILALTMLGAVAGVLAYVSTPPTYATKVDFYVSTPKTEGTSPQSSGQFAESRVNSYIVLLSSEDLAKRVVASTGLQLTPGQLARKVTATATLNTVVVNAIITDDNPQRSLVIAQGVADNFGKMVDELDNAGRADQIVVINVVSGPTLNPNPVAPDTKLYIGAGIAAGLLLGLVIAILREVLDTSVRTVEVAQRLIGAPVIGNISFDPEAKRSPLIVGEESTSVRAEAFRHLRTNLQFIDAAKSANTILVTSAVALEGKTSTAVNLALTFVEFGERVLIIEADLRRPAVAEILEMPRRAGLTNVLAGQAELTDVVQQWGTSGLSLLSSGSLPPNPSELLGSTRMAELVRALETQFDKIVIDSPPVLPVTDAVVASSLVEAVVIVIRHGKTGRGQVATATRALDNVGARIVGSVLNMRKASRTDARRYGTHQLPVSAPGWTSPVTSIDVGAESPVPAAPAPTPSHAASNAASNGATNGLGSGLTEETVVVPGQRTIDDHRTHRTPPRTRRDPQPSVDGPPAGGREDLT